MRKPQAVILVATGFILATAKLIDSVSGIQSRRAYAKRMNQEQDAYRDMRRRRPSYDRDYLGRR